MALAHAYYNRWTSDPDCSIAEAGKLVDEAIDRDPIDPFALTVHGAEDLGVGSPLAEQFHVRPDGR